VAARQRKSTHTATAHVAKPNTRDTSRENSQLKPSFCINALAKSMLMYQSVTATGITMKGRR
jgi:hypothetical protein